MHVLKVVTLNIWNKSGPWTERLGMIRDELRALSPDVVGLQEVMRLSTPNPGAPGPSVANDQAAEIAEGFGYNAEFAPAQEYGGGLVMGNALLSKHTIVEAQRFVLPGVETGETRSLLFSMVDLPQGRLPVFVTHLNWRLNQGSVRMRQVLFIAERIAELVPLDSKCLPPVLMGDMNAEPDSDEMRFLRGLHTHEGRSVFFADSWIYGGDGGPGITFDPKNDFAASAHEPPRRIDYIFSRGPDRTLRGEPLITRVVFAGAKHAGGGRIFPSDHYGLYTELAIEPRSL